MIADSDITFVIQGPYVRGGHSCTHQCLDSIRQYFPDSVVILSTWEESGAHGSLPDGIAIVESRDPGAEITRDISGARNNVNRQIVSTLAGLQQVKTRYAVKMRSDLRICSRDFTSIAAQYSERSDNYQIFSERITACRYYFRHAKIQKYPFHPSDIFLFGRTDDLLLLWDIPVTVEPEFSRWFESRPRPKPDYDKLSLFKCAPEQYIWTSCMNRNGYSMTLESPVSADPDLLAMSEESLINNFYFESPQELGLIWPRRLKTSYSCSVMTKMDFVYLYGKYCLKAVSVPIALNYNLRLCVNKCIMYIHHQLRCAWLAVKLK